MASVTVKEAMDRAARRCGVTPPTSWIADTTLTIQELRDDFLMETVDELLDRVDWPGGTSIGFIGRTQTITGTGVQEYDLDTEFKRLKRDPLAVYESSKTRRGAIPVNTGGQWTYLNDIGTGAQHRWYRTHGYDENFIIEFYPALETDDTVTVHYVSKRWARTATGLMARKDTWTDEADILLLPRRLVELGVVWRFRSRKGLPFESILSEYEMRLSRAANDAQGIRIISGSDTLSDDFKPMRVPVPDFIPSS